jgi:hypothetical protein
MYIFNDQLLIRINLSYFFFWNLNINLLKLIKKKIN